MRLAAVLLTAVLASHAAASPFDSHPERYDEMVNPALRQIRSGLWVRETACTADGRLRCRFAARQVDIEVTGPAGRTGTERITVAATFRRGNDQAAQALIDDTLTILGATMVAYDPGMSPERRSEMLLELGEAAINIGEAHRDSADVHYSLSFDDVSGRLEITAATLRVGHG